MSCLRPGGLDLTRELLAKAKVPPGSVVADLGCGSGESVAYLARCGYRALGLDLAACEVAGCQVGDMQHLPWALGSLGAVLAECSLSVCGDRNRALAECYRVLEPGGKLLISDVFFKDGGMLAQGQGGGFADWALAIGSAGFQIQEMLDVSELWRGFMAWCIWTDLDPAVLWCDLVPPEGVAGVGYFTLWGIKIVDEERKGVL